MSNESAELIRRAYQAYTNGDLPAMLELVDPDLEWTYLDPNLEHPPRRSATAVTSWSSCWEAGPSTVCGSSWRRSRVAVSW
jgi:hypothetical protein